MKKISVISLIALCCVLFSACNSGENQTETTAPTSQVTTSSGTIAKEIIQPATTAAEQTTDTATTKAIEETTDLQEEVTQAQNDEPSEHADEISVDLQMTIGNTPVSVDWEDTPNTDMTVEIYGKTLHVQAVLDKTGTELDSALYVDIDTMKELIRAHNEKNPNQEKTIDPDNVVSSVLIKVADGYDIDEVAGDINLHVRQVKAIRTQNMISGVSESLSGVSATISLLMVVVWILSVVILAIVFTMNINERKKEFAVLRVLGASRVKLAGLVFREAALYGFLGSLFGAVLTVLITALFTPAIENMIGLPFLLPPVPVMLIAGALTVVLTVAAGAVTAASSAVKISKIDTGLILRGDD